MNIILKRVTIIALALALIALIGYLSTDGTVAAAIRQWFLWIWRPIQPAVQPVLNWFARMTQGGLLRQATKVFWRIAFGILIGILIRFGMQKFQILRPFAEMRIWRREKVRLVLGWVRWGWGYTLPLPRWARALVAIAAIIAAFFICVEVGHALGDSLKGWTKSLVFSIAIFWLVEKLPLIGFDALASITLERWRWFQAFKDRHTWIKRIYEFPGWLLWKSVEIVTRTRVRA